MGKSARRVEAGLVASGVDHTLKVMPDSMRTSQQAADVLSCTVGQIAKSMIFEGADSGHLKLLIVSGAHDVDLARAPDLFGEPLARADPKRVRSETGFAIGGVAPVGHLSPLDVWFDTALLAYDIVWAAAGAPEAVFAIAPADLQRITGAQAFSLSA